MKSSSGSFSTKNNDTDAVSSKVSSSVMTASSPSDSEETSEEHCLMSYTALPATPEKKVVRICHTIVKEGKAIVAFPSPPKPHPLPKLPFPQRGFFSRSLEGQMNTADSAKQTVVQSGSSVFSQSTSLGGYEVSQRTLGMFGSHSQLCFSDKAVFKGAAEGLHHEKREGEECNHQNDKKESTSVSTIGDQHDPQGLKESHNSNNLQGMGNKQTSTVLGNTTCIHEEDNAVYENQNRELFREEEEEGGKGEEEEDSDVLRIEEHSENENDYAEVTLGRNVRLSEMFEIFSLNLEDDCEIGGEQQRPSPPTTKQIREEKNPTSSRRKTVTQCSQETHTRHHTTPVTSKRATARKERSSSGMPGCRELTEEQRTSCTASLKTPSSREFLSPAEECDAQRSVQDAGYYAGCSQPSRRREESHTSTKKKRRITPIRIGDVEWHVMGSKGSWNKPGTPKDHHWGQSRGNAGTHLET